MYSIGATVFAAIVVVVVLVVAITTVAVTILVISYRKAKSSKYDMNMITACE